MKPIHIQIVCETVATITAIVLICSMVMLFVNATTGVSIWDYVITCGVCAVVMFVSAEVLAMCEED